MHYKILTVALSIMLTGCQTTTHITYSPASTVSAEGELRIGSFEYLPASRGELAVNQIKQVPGKITLAEPVGAYFQNALFVELRFVGVDVGKGDLTLTGQIIDFHWDGWKVDANLNVRYQLVDAQGESLYSKQIDTENDYPIDSFVTIDDVLNSAIRTSIEQLLDDPQFRDLIR